MRDMLLRLADELESMDVREGCRTCPADGTKDCRGDVSCEEAVARVAARRIREIVERDECEVTTVSAYDLLPDEDRKAIAWVREYGGLEAVEKRLMPEGMEWPRFESGEPVRIGEHWEEDGFDESVTRIDSIEFADDGVRFENEYNEVFCRYGERAKRPTPKVLDADGVEIRAGDTVYGFAGQQYEVTGLCEYEPSIVHAKTVGDGVAADELLALSGQLNSAQLDASKLTHRAPVLAADGKPLRVGETVYDVEDEKGYPHIVTSTELDGFGHVKTTCEEPTPASVSIHPNRLTHERPDTWERLEHDAEKTVCEYFGANYDCANCPLESARCAEEVKKDIIRRAKKLAERGE